MNLTGRSVTPKGEKKNKKPTQEQHKLWERVRELGCIVCGVMAEIHHVGTKQGARKDHDRVIGLCTAHHRGRQGRHGMGLKAFEAMYGTEQELFEITLAKLD